MARHALSFGGCGRLLSQYKTIGRELLNYEAESGSFLKSNRHEKLLEHFREGVVFVPAEVLQSYLDDLLNLEIEESSLFIDRGAIGARTYSGYLPLGGVLLAIASGLYASSTGASYYLSFALTVCLAVPFLVLWRLEHNSAARRLRFAQILSQEIARRRGYSGGDMVGLFSVQGLFGGSEVKTAVGTSFRIRQ